MWLLSAALAGLALMALRRHPRQVLFIAVPLLYYVAVASRPNNFARYIVPVIPFLCIAAGYALLEKADTALVPYALGFAALSFALLFGIQYLLRASGFERVEIRYRSPLPDHVKLQMAYVPDDIRVAADASAATLTKLVDTSNANAVRMNELMFAHMDYAVVGYRI